MLPTFGNTQLASIAEFTESLSLKERKCLITLARSQLFPISTDKTLLDKTQDILDKIVTDPPYLDYRYEQFSEIGSLLFECITTPYLNGLVISLCLGATVSKETAIEQYRLSFNKEFSATQTRRKDAAWNWEMLLWGRSTRDEVVHPIFPNLSKLQFGFASDLERYRRRQLSGRIIKPHYTRRGISSETGEWIINRSRLYHTVKYGSARTFHRGLDRRNVKSKDVVHHYIRTGSWPPGRVEMRQQWKPSILTPRTYFAWGGNAIRCSTYLREIFNQIADVFAPSHRHNRVQPSWLRPLETARSPSFLFYDLTSFTSWFHEHEPFLRELSKFFRGTNVFLVGEGMYLTEADVGFLIEQYTDNVNSFPEFYISSGITEARESIQSLYHLTAGFLGVPGNLVTCTLAHGLAQAGDYTDEHQLQVPGDDVGCETKDDTQLMDKSQVAQTLGQLQLEKVYTSDQASVYLKRGVRITLGGVNLTDMLIWPLFPYLQSPTLRKADFIDPRVTLPPPDQRLPRACQVIVTFFRSIWKISHGSLPLHHKEFIIDFLTSLHKHLGLPLTGILQGRTAGTREREDPLFRDVSVKFPVDIRYLESDPDILFANEFVEVFVVRDIRVEDILVTFDGDIPEGSFIKVFRKHGWSFLEDMGYVERVQKYAGDAVILIGADAKDAYLSGSSPRVSEYRVLSDISMAQLASLSIIPSYEGSDFERISLDLYGRIGVDVDPLSSFSLSYPAYVAIPNENDDDENEFGPDGLRKLWRDEVMELDETEIA